jgi:hypothetical protein
MPARPATQFEIRLPGSGDNSGAAKSRGPYPSGEYFIWPFNLRVTKGITRSLLDRPIVHAPRECRAPLRFTLKPSREFRWSLPSTLRSCEAGADCERRRRQRTMKALIYVRDVQPGIEFRS